MKGLFISAQEHKSEELRQKAEEMLILKERMNSILDKQIEYSRDEEDF